MFLPNGDLDWTYYYAEIAKARAQRIMFFAVGLAVGFAIALAILYIF